MNNDLKREIDNCELEVETIKTHINRNSVDSTVKYLTNYAVVRVCSLLEYVLKHLICDYLSDNSSNEAKQFLKNIIVESSTNPSTGNIEKLFENFNTKKSENLKKNGNIQKLKTDINHLVALRNSIAHGRNNTTTINTVVRYFESSKAYINEVEHILTNQIVYKENDFLEWK